MPFGIGKDTFQDTQFRPDSHSSDFDFSGALGHAEQHGSSRSDLLGAAVNYLKENSGRFTKEDVDEERAVKAHKALYEGGSGSADKHDSDSLGMGAALQALKLFMGQSHGGSGDKSQLIGLAMAQAEKLFDQKAAEGKAVSAPSQFCCMFLFLDGRRGKC